MGFNSGFKGLIFSFPFSSFCSFLSCLPVCSLSFSFSSFLSHILHCLSLSPSLSQFGVVSSFVQFLPEGSKVAVWSSRSVTAIRLRRSHSLRALFFRPVFPRFTLLHGCWCLLLFRYKVMQVSGASTLSSLNLAKPHFFCSLLLEKLFPSVFDQSLARTVFNAQGKINRIQDLG